MNLLSDKIPKQNIGTNTFLMLEIGLIVLPSIFPLFFNLPYRINIFLSWEGAYRLYLGQTPYEDFGLPLGYGFWLIPALFFKLFGPYLVTLIKAQVFINIISLLAFRNILKLLEVEAGKRILAILILVLSYSFPSFWPWYNHTVFVFQLISLNLLLLAVFNKPTKWNYFFIISSGLFAFLSFFTKQDSGAIAIVFGGILLLYDAATKKRYVYLTVYSISIVLYAVIFIAPMIQHDFFYWFNLGQSPHSSRINFYSFANKFFSESHWEKFYLLLITLVLWNKFRSVEFTKGKKFYFFVLIALGITLQSIIIQVTSPLTPDGQKYFHAFAFAFLISSVNLEFSFKNIFNLTPFLILILLWWSPLLWDYTTRILKIYPSNSNNVQTDFSSIQSKWVTTDEFKSLKGLQMPEETLEGIRFLKNLNLGETPKVLNMTELTPLAYELGYSPPINQPLWYHLNVGIFQKEIDILKQRIMADEYDLVLFQSIPGLDNFFPYEIQDQLKNSYKLVKTFEAPRKRSEGYSFIEVYIRK